MYILVKRINRCVLSDRLQPPPVDDSLDRRPLRAPCLQGLTKCFSFRKYTRGLANRRSGRRKWSSFDRSRRRPIFGRMYWHQNACQIRYAQAGPGSEEVQQRDLAVLDILPQQPCLGLGGSSQPPLGLPEALVLAAGPGTGPANHAAHGVRRWRSVQYARTYDTAAQSARKKIGSYTNQCVGQGSHVVAFILWLWYCLHCWFFLYVNCMMSQPRTTTASYTKRVVRPGPPVINQRYSWIGLDIASHSLFIVYNYEYLVL